MRGVIVPQSAALRKCPVGLTPKQATILATLAQHQERVLSYDDLAYAANALWGVELTKVAARELADKLNSKGFFYLCETAREGVLQGKKYIISQKCCSTLLLPVAAPLMSPQPPAYPLPHTATQAIAQPTAPTAPYPTAHAPLLLNQKKTEEKERHFPFSEEETPQITLPDELFSEIVENFAESWPCLLKVGFDADCFMRAVQASPHKILLLRTHRQSLDYAEYELRYQGFMKAKGQRVDSPRDWVFGCFKKSGQYPRPENYKSRENLAQEAAAEALRKEDEVRCREAFSEWRKQQSDEDIRAYFSDWNFRFSPPENVIEERFQKRIWPELRKQQMPAEG